MACLCAVNNEQSKMFHTQKVKIKETKLSWSKGKCTADEINIIKHDLKNKESTYNSPNEYQFIFL